MFVEPYLAGHEQEIDKTLQDAQTQAKAMGLEYIKRGIAAVQKLVLDTLAKAAAGGQPPASSESFQAAAAAPGAKAGDPTSAPAPPAAAGAPGYLSWAYNMVSPKLTAVATMASQKVSSQLPSRPLPRPPINLYSPSSESGTEPNLAAGGTPGQPSSSASSSQGYFWRRQPSSAMAVDPSEGDLRQSSGLGITPPVSPDDQKRLDHLSNHLETAAGFISRAYLAPTASSSSSPSGAGGASTGANPMANATAADVRRRTLSLYGVESDHE
ncbi:hypothetical protein DFQ27_004310 [Actinomortierella ambigua]|uniref:Uncharacterized protein n=1 Tax=Actinomortierella ambigua TaxID=1343610 RepID=A0A9P6QMH0_9FUNG|nr:hypothetical protein DFQ27_004310 [Actinomortierella ambigua]